MLLPISRKRLLLLLGLATVVVGYSIWWWQLAGGLRDGVARWAAMRNAAGWQVDTGEVAISGFPLAVRLSFRDPAVADPFGNGWRGPKLEATISPLMPNRPHLSAPGRHVLTLAGGPPVELTAAQLTGDLVITSSGIEQLSLAVTKLEGAGMALGSFTGNLRRLAEGTVVHTTPSYGLSAELEGLVIPTDPRLPLGHTVAKARLEARLMGSVTPGPLRPALAAWRDDGGTVEIDGLSVDWPPLGLVAKGTVALDGAMQPLIATSSTLRGLFEAIDALTKSGAIRPKDAGMAKLVLGLLTRPAADGVLELTVPLTVQNRILYLGPAALMTLPEVAW